VCIILGYLNPQRLGVLRNVMNMLDGGRDLHLKIVDTKLCAKEKKKPRPEDARQASKNVKISSNFVEFPEPETFHRISTRLSFCRR
jgi:hypothetical protein